MENSAGPHAKLFPLLPFAVDLIFSEHFFVETPDASGSAMVLKESGHKLHVVRIGQAPRP